MPKRQASSKNVLEFRQPRKRLMTRLQKLAVLLLLCPLQACSTVGPQTEAPAACTSAPLCKNLGLVKPSRKNDKFSDPTAQRIADNNIAIEEACSK